IASVSPERAMANAGPKPFSQTAATLELMPPSYIDQRVLDEIREKHEDPLFLAQALSTAVGDMERRGSALLAAIDNGEAEPIRISGQTLNEIALSVGAVRLSGAIDRLMLIECEELSATRIALRKDIEG